MALPVITIKHLDHRGNKNIALYFDFDQKLISHTKKIDGVKWSASNKCWYIENATGLLHRIFTHFRNIAWLNNQMENSSRKRIKTKKVYPGNAFKKQLTDDVKNELLLFKNKLFGLRYSKSTADTYVNLLEAFFGYHHDKKPAEIEMTDIETYNFEVIVKCNYSVVYQRQLVGALKLFYKHNDNLNIDTELLERPRRTKSLPIVLSRDEILRLLLATPNLKHRSILAVLYGSGLRISELINLKVADIDFARKQLFVANSKGGKDRVVALSERIYGLLNDYLQTYQPDTFLFNGQSKLQYTAGSVRQFLSQSVKRAGINKKVTPHTLRHTYATHLLEGGVDLKYVQELLGHSKPETTQIYLHVTKKQLLAINSPLDSLLVEAKKEHLLLDKMNKTSSYPEG